MILELLDKNVEEHYINSTNYSYKVSVNLSNFKHRLNPQIKAAKCRKLR